MQKGHHFDDIMHLMSGGNTVDMVYLDFAKECSSVKSILLVSLVNWVCGVPFLNT